MKIKIEIKKIIKSHVLSDIQCNKKYTFHDKTYGLQKECKCIIRWNLNKNKHTRINNEP